MHIDQRNQPDAVAGYPFQAGFSLLPGRRQQEPIGTALNRCPSQFDRGPRTRPDREVAFARDAPPCSIRQEQELGLPAIIPNEYEHIDVRERHHPKF